MEDGAIYRYEVPDSLTEEMVEEALADLPSWRLEKALAYKRPRDRFLCAQAYHLLKYALYEEYGYDGDFTFEYGPAGKPSLKERPDIHFNISHCHGCVCCVVSSSPVGIDVEDILYDEALIESVCSESELEMLAASERPDIEFTKLWAMKESLLKLSGEGIADDMKTVLQGIPATYFEVMVNYGYVLCAAAGH